MPVRSKKKPVAPLPAANIQQDEGPDFDYVMYREKAARLAVGEDESRDDFDKLFDLTVTELKPSDPVERTLVQHIVWAFWRLEQVKLAEVRIVQLAVQELKTVPDIEPERLQAMALDILSRSQSKPLERLSRCQELAYENCQRSMKLLGSYRNMRAGLVSESLVVAERAETKVDLAQAIPVTKKIQ